MIKDETIEKAITSLTHEELDLFIAENYEYLSADHYRNCVNALNKISPLIKNNTKSIFELSDKIYDGKTHSEIIEMIYLFHLQNTNGRETADEMFRLGIKACYNELVVHKDDESDTCKIKAYKLIDTELTRAEKKHPIFPSDMFRQLAIMQEEAGEVTKAVLDYHYEGASIQNVKTELIQTGAMCVRMLINLNS